MSSITQAVAELLAGVPGGLAYRFGTGDALLLQAARLDAELLDEAARRQGLWAQPQRQALLRRQAAARGMDPAAYAWQVLTAARRGEPHPAQAAPPAPDNRQELAAVQQSLAALEQRLGALEVRLAAVAADVEDWISGDLRRVLTERCIERMDQGLDAMFYRTSN